MKIVWDDHWRPPDERRLAIEERVRNDLASELDGLDKPEDLIFHHVFLGDERTDETVFVYGVEGSEAFHCKYDPKPQWVRMSDVMDE